MPSNILYVGTKAHVVAVDQATGQKLWQTKLKGGLTNGERFVSLLVQDGRVFAHTYGELFCLDQETGAVLWKNSLDGVGYDLATLACNGAPSSPTQAMMAAWQKKKSRDAAVAVGLPGGDH